MSSLSGYTRRVWYSARYVSPASRDFLRELIDGREIIIETVKDQRGKYGRYLAEIWIGQDGVWINVNDALVAASHAVYQDYLFFFMIGGTSPIGDEHEQDIGGCFGVIWQPENAIYSFIL